MSDVAQRVAELDTTLFHAIPAQSSERDRSSLLRCQTAVRALRPNYVYLEIGSHLGGSIQPHLLDEACTRIYSIDQRPSTQPDSRGLNFRYPNNSTARMVEQLRTLSPEQVPKIVCIEGSTATLHADTISRPPDLCFVDGEHTDDAVRGDARFCLATMRDAGVLVFHDAHVVYNGLWDLLSGLGAEGRVFHAYNLPDYLLVVEIGDFPIHRHPLIADMLRDNWVGYLTSLRANDTFRRWANLFPVRTVRRVHARFRSTDTDG